MYIDLLAGLLGILYKIFFTAGYFSGANMFPQPLSSEEERKYLDLYLAGDQEAKNKLIEHNLRLVAHIVKKYCSNQNDMDDLISIGTIGLIKGITTYNRSKGTKLATYAARCIENEILMQIRVNNRKRSEISLQEPIGTDREGNEITMSDILPCDSSDAVMDEVVLRSQIRALYDRMKHDLKEREKTIIKLRYGLYDGVEKTQIEIARMLNISRSYVSRIEKKAVAKLLEGLVDYGDS